MSDRILGVLGGMGPLASAHFMTRLTLLTPAATDQEHIPTVLWSDPRVPDRTLARQAGPSPLPAMLRGIAGLRGAGCGAIAIPCNTAHGWFDAMAAEAGIPLLHIVDATIAALRRTLELDRQATIGVMGTAATLALRLYQDRLEAQGWKTIVPSATEMQFLVSRSIALVKANRPHEAFEPLAQAAAALQARGAVVVVLGCTELPLAALAGPRQQIPVRLVDSIDALALAAIAWARPDLA